MSDRRLKRSALRDVAGMLRSFHYAAAYAVKHETVRPQDVVVLAGWARFWELWVSVLFLKAYLDTAGPAGFLPRNPAETQSLLDVLVLEKALYELLYELNNRPEWVPLPLQGIARLLDGGGETG